MRYKRRHFSGLLRRLAMTIRAAVIARSEVTMRAVVIARSEVTMRAVVIAKSEVTMRVVVIASLRSNPEIAGNKRFINFVLINW